MKTKKGALYDVVSERIRQDEKWGQQNHEPEWWLAILMEEVGELAQAILETHFDKNPEHLTKGGIVNIRKEAIQCAAVAVALVECIDRNQNAPREGRAVARTLDADVGKTGGSKQ